MVCYLVSRFNVIALREGLLPDNLLSAVFVLKCGVD